MLNENNYVLSKTHPHTIELNVDFTLKCLKVTHLHLFYSMFNIVTGFSSLSYLITGNRSELVTITSVNTENIKERFRHNFKYFRVSLKITSRMG